jgi:hypothetical protein
MHIYLYVYTSVDVISTADLTVGAISSAVKALYVSSNTEEMSVLLEKMYGSIESANAKRAVFPID